MQYKAHPDEEKELVPSNSESELQPDLGTPKLRLLANDAPLPTVSEGTLRTSARPKALAASAPGTEYWLP